MCGASGRTDLSRCIYEQGVDGAEIWAGCGPVRGVLEKREEGTHCRGLERTPHPLGERYQRRKRKRNQGTNGG